MDKCKPFNEHKYRVFQDYFRKFYNTTAICDTPDKETADFIVKALTKYLIKEIEYDVQ